MRVLVVDDEEGLREFLCDALEARDRVVESARDGREAMTALSQRAFDVVLTDLKMPGPDGLEVLRYCLNEQPTAQVILLTAHGSVESAVEAMKIGAFDYLRKPLSGPDELRLIVRRAAERRRWLLAAEGNSRERASVPQLDYGDPVMRSVTAALRKVAPTEATVLLTGESGTGKEVAAQTVHEASSRADGPFVAINCAAVTETLLESELFGHEKGAFTGAVEARTGRIELAAGGTLFLDEIGELKLELQAKLLRVLQERTFERVGGVRTHHAEVRWIAATNRDLEERVREGSFREDLFHRLAVFPVEIPPLRERRADILPIAERLLGRAAATLGREPLILSSAAREAIAAAHWPGNVRELGNVLERAVILSDGGAIGVDDLLLRGPADGTAGTATTGGAAAADATSGQTLAEIEGQAIARELERQDGNRRRVAEVLGIGERTLYDKLRKYGLS